MDKLNQSEDIMMPETFAGASGSDNKSDEQISNEGLLRMEEWMKKLGLSMNISDLGVTDDMIEGIADATFILNGGYKVLKRDEVIKVLKASM